MNAEEFATRFGYDDANRVITMSYPGGDVVTNTFDLAGQPYGLYAAGSALVKSAAYNALGAPTRVSFGNGLDKVNQYFGLDVSAGGAWGPLFAYGKLRNTCVITAGTACGTEASGALLNTVYWYDKAGNVTTVRDNVLNSKVDARYDALNRLVVVSSTNYITGVAQMAPMSETYSYNAIGNLTGRFGVGGTGAITYPAAGSVRPHAATGAGLNSYVYDANGNMTVRREVSGTETFVYTQTWSIDNRLIGVTKALTNGAVLAQTSYFYDGDGVRVRKDDPDGTTLYAGPVEQTIGPGGTATAEYFDDITGTSTLTAFVATRNETVTAGFQQTFTVPPAGLGNEPWGVRYQIWLTVPTTDSYRLAVYADDGFILSGQGLSLSNATIRDVTTTEASTVLTLTPGAIYNFALTYLNYTSATTSALQLLWRKGSGALEAVPKESIRARGRRDYYSFGGAVVAMKEGVMGSVTRTLSYLHGDHLGSASLTTNASGQKVSEQRYKPYGEVRWTSGPGLPTDKQFTSQMRLVEGYVGTLYDYVARAYDPVLGRFISADSIVPGAGNSQAFNRYSYVRGSPLGMVDPSGHAEQSPDGGGSNCQSQAFGCGNFVQDFTSGFVSQAAQNVVGTITPWIVSSLVAWPEQIRTSYSAVTRLWDVASTEGVGAATSEYGDMVSGAAYSLIAPYVDPIRAGHGGETVGRLAAQLLTAKAMSKLLGGGCSFSDDTEIATEQGPLTISDVVTGTRVLAWDETTNTTGFYPVTYVWVHWDPVVVVLIVNGETITTTPEHPFYTPMHGWLPAGELWVGAGLRRAEGGAGIVESTTTVTRTELMWNLTVDEAHTFYVGDGEWLVHNTGTGCPIIGEAQRTLDPKHALRSSEMAEAMAKSGQYSTVFLDASSGIIGEVAGVNVTTNIMPDVTGLRPNGAWHMVEYLSRGQSWRGMIAKLEGLATELDLKGVLTTWEIRRP